jgi:para-nitrobenzyl esterase
VLSLDSAERVAAAMLAELGVSAPGAGALLELPVEELLRAQAAVSTQAIAPEEFRLAFSPAVDGEVLPVAPADAVRDGAAANDRLLVGTTADEYRLFSLMDRARGPLTDEKLVDRVGKVVGADRAADAIAVYRADRPGASIDDVWNDFATDWVFRIPAIRLAEAQSAHQPDTYSYLFSYKSTAFNGALGACHAIDVPFVFGNLRRRGVDMLLGPITQETEALERATVGAWLSMARSGAPSAADLPEWPQYSASRRAVMELGLTRQVLDDPGAAERQLWEMLSA